MADGMAPGAQIVMVIASVQFITTGVVGELLTRTYFESSNAKPYLVRTQSESERVWAGDLDQPDGSESSDVPPLPTSS